MWHATVLMKILIRGVLKRLPRRNISAGEVFVWVKKSAYGES